MDMGGKDEAETAKRNEDAMNFDSDNMPSQWQLNGANLVIPNSNPNTDSFCPAIWDRSINSPTFLHGVTTSNLLGSGMVVDRNVGMFWTQPNASGMLPQFPADSDFIERAARFSCFGGGNFCDPINPFSTTEPMNPYAKGVMPTQKAREVFAGNEQYQEHEMTNVGESSKEREGSRPRNDQKNETTFEAKQCVVEGSGNESGEPECSSPGDQDVSEGAVRESPGASKKRKQSGRIDKTKGTPPRLVDATKDHKDQNLMSTTSKQGGKNAKKGTEASDSPNEEYIHVRARRGQATNSHSLAERVRREKISQRMKLLQDLVPGCNKVTGKAVMLDEIINYVQSLQRQVEFLSMKLATVIPRLDFNVEGLLAKDILQSQTGPSSLLAFPPDMTMPYPPINPPHPLLVQAGLPGYVNSINALQRAINSEKATMNVPNVWDHELQNLLQMGFKPNAPLNSQEDHSSLPTPQTNSES